MRLIDADKLERIIMAMPIEKMCDDCAYNVISEMDNMPTVSTDNNVLSKWVSVKDKMPPNADRPGAFCPKYQVVTKYGVTEGWYNPDKGRWYTLVWFFLGRKTFDDIDFDRGDIPGITDKIEVTHWKEIPEPPKEDEP